MNQTFPVYVPNFSGDSVAKRLETQSGSVRFLHSFPRIGKADSGKGLPASSLLTSKVTESPEKFEETDVTFEV